MHLRTNPRGHAEGPSAALRAVQRRRRLDLDLLAVLVALDDTRSVSAAALVLGMSQPQVSVALGKLRELFNDAVFVRTTHGMQPTPRAVILAKSARGVLAQIDQDLFVEDSFDPATAQRPFVLALSDAGEAVMMPRMLNMLRQAAPYAPVRSVNLRVADVARGLESGEIDLAVGYLPDLCKRNFFQQTLFTDGYVSLVRAGHPITAAQFGIEQFLEFEHAVVCTPIRHQEPIDLHLARRRIRCRVGFICPHVVTLPGIAAESDMIITVARRLAEHFLALGAPLRKVELPFPVPAVEIRQHWHSKFRHDARSKWLRSLIAGAFHDHSAVPEERALVIRSPRARSQCGRVLKTHS
jgi:DNA-binding transcriptional LysR family regulator